MAKVIVEVQARGLDQYQGLEQFPVTLGRALDNDIILSDRSVSPHHLRIESGADGQLLAYNLSDENGTRLNGNPLGSQPVEVRPPCQLMLGNRKIRLLSSDMAVEPTDVRHCRGAFSLLCSPFWAAGLFVATLLTLVLDNYMDTVLSKGVLFYLSNLLPNLLVLVIFTLLISGVTRLVVHRWEFAAATSVASLFTLVPLLLYEVGHWLNYLWTSDMPTSWLMTGSDFLLLPALLYLFLRKVNHQRRWHALGVALLLSSPLLAYQAMNVLDEYSVGKGFSAAPSYNQTLSSFNVHAAPSLGLDDYLKQASDALPPQQKGKGTDE